MKPVFALASAGAVLALGFVGAGSGAAAQGAAPSGEIIFKQRCSSCHSVTAGEPNGVGPNLAGIVGRQAASRSFNYSPALKKSNLVWTSPNLDRYLAAPAKTVPGTRMVVALPDAKQRAALIDYLAKSK